MVHSPLRPFSSLCYLVVFWLSWKCSVTLTCSYSISYNCIYFIVLILQTMARCVYLYLGDSMSFISRSSTFDLALHFDSVSLNNYFSSDLQHGITSNFCVACFFPTTDYCLCFGFQLFPALITTIWTLQTVSLILGSFHFNTLSLKI